MKIYHYTTLDAFAKIWVSKQLRFSEFKNTNDIFERSKQIGLHSIPMYSMHENATDAIIRFSKLYGKVLAQFKQISFTYDYRDMPGCVSSMMWGQYAHNEKGVCIELDSNKLPKLNRIYRSKISYKKTLPPIIQNRKFSLDTVDLTKYIIENRKFFFFIKHKHWEHENEYRMISKDLDYLSIENAVNKVYVFDSHSIETRIIEHIVGEEVPIEYIEVRQNEKKEIKTVDLNSLRKLEKLLENEPDYYTNKEKVTSRALKIIKKIE